MADKLVPPWIPSRPLLMVIGQSPGTGEADRGIPFIGPSGQQLRIWLTSTGLLPAKDVLYDNVVREYKGPTYKPTDTEITRARKRVEQDVPAFPSLRGLLLLGAPAAHMLWKGRMGQMHGKQSEWCGLPVFGCYHPSYYLRSQTRQLEQDILRVVRQAADVALGKAPKQPSIPEYTEVEEIEIR